MLPVSAWPPGPPGASLSPFGKPRDIPLNCYPNGYILPKGAWVIRTMANSVIMRVWQQIPFNPARTPGTGLLPGWPPPPGIGGPPQVQPVQRTRDSTPCPQPKQFMRYNDYVEAWRAWQRTIGRNDPPIRPLAGHRPPNWFGWVPKQLSSREIFTLLRPNSSGTVLADGENVVIVGCGCATILQAFSV